MPSAATALPPPDLPSRRWLPELPPLPDLAPLVKAIIAGVICLYAVFITLGPVVVPDATPQGAMLAAGNFVFMLPFLYVFVLRRAAYPVFHPVPLVLGFALVKLCLKRTGLFLYGIEDNLAISASKETLTGLFVYGNCLSALGYGCFIWGATRVSRISRLPLVEFAPIRKIFIPTVVAFVVALMTMVYLVGISGNMVDHLLQLSRSVSSKLSAAGGAKSLGQIFALINLPIYAIMFWIAVKKDIQRNPLFWILAAASLVLAYLASGKRSPVIFPAIQFGIIWCLANRRIPYLFVTIGLVSGLLAIGALGVVRKASWSAQDITTVTDAVKDTGAVGGMNEALDEMQYRSEVINPIYPILYYVPKDVPLLWGKGYATLLIRPVPRQLWPNKPRGMDYRVGVTFFGSEWGMPAGMLGEAYWNFHIPGVAFIFFLYGYVLSIFWHLFLRAPTLGAPLVLYAYNIIGFQITEVALTNWMVGMSSLFVLLFISGGLRLSRPQHSR